MRMRVIYRIQLYIAHAAAAHAQVSAGCTVVRRGRAAGRRSCELMLASMVAAAVMLML